MNERYDPNLLLDYIEGELPDEARQRVEAMLAEDPKLAAMVVGMQQDRAALREADPGDLPRDLVGDALAQVERQMLLDDDVAVPSPAVAAPVNRFRLAPLLTYGGIAAVLALTGAVVFQSLQSDSSDAVNQPLALAEETPGVGLAEAPIEAQRLAAEADGSGDSAASDAFARLPAQEEADMLGEALANVERSIAPEAVASRQYFDGFDESDLPAVAIAPAETERLARLSADLETPEEFWAAERSESVASLADAAPRYRVNVYTRSADLTRQQLDDWAFSNRVALAETPDETAAPSGGAAIDADRDHAAVAASLETPLEKNSPNDSPTPTPSLRGAESRLRAAQPSPPAAQQQVVLQLDQQQVGQLLTELNRDNLRQNAIVLPTPERAPQAMAAAPRSVVRQEIAAAESAEVPEDAWAAVDGQDHAFFNDATVVTRGMDRETAPAAAPVRSEKPDFFVERQTADSQLLGQPFRSSSIPPIPSALPWLNWVGPPQPVLVEVVIEEAPATLRQTPAAQSIP